MTYKVKHPFDSAFNKKTVEALSAKKKLGQNFLVNQRTIDQMMKSCAFTKEDIVLEIGPGTGTITRILAPLVKNVIAVEADKKLAAALDLQWAGSNVRVHQGDILDFDLASLPPRIKLFGNIPYNISTPIIAWVLKNKRSFTECYLTVQLEFAERLLAKIKSKDRCPLSCLIEAFTDTSILFPVHPRAFQPIPKVMSCFIKVCIKDRPCVDIKDEGYFQKIIKESFLQRRKTLLNALGHVVAKEQLASVLAGAGIPALARAEDLTIQDFARLTSMLQR